MSRNNNSELEPEPIEGEDFEIETDEKEESRRGRPPKGTPEEEKAKALKAKVDAYVEEAKQANQNPFKERFGQWEFHKGVYQITNGHFFLDKETGKKNMDPKYPSFALFVPRNGFVDLDAIQNSVDPRLPDEVMKKTVEFLKKGGAVRITPAIRAARGKKLELIKKHQEELEALKMAETTLIE